MAKVSRAYLAHDYICAECESPLVEMWDREVSALQVKCGSDKAHIGFKHWREGKTEQERKARQMTSDSNHTELAHYSGSLTLDRSEAEEILKTIWPDAPKSEVLKAALICKQYGLNPLMRHIYLVKYDRREKAKQVNGVWEKGKLIGEDWSIQIGIGATRMIARRSGAYSYEDDTPRLMTEAEQIKILGAVEPDTYWAITKLRAKDGSFAQGYGNWPRETPVKGSEKGNTPQNMAGIRSERAALDKLFPEKLPAGVEVVEAEYMEAPRIINGKTGEIKVLPPSPPQGEERNPPIQPASLDYLARPYPPGSEPNLGKTQSPEPVKVSVERPKTAPTPPTAYISQDRIDQLSRDLTAIGYLPAKREALFASKAFQDVYPGVTQLRDLTAEQADRLEEWIKKKAALWVPPPSSDSMNLPC